MSLPLQERAIDENSTALVRITAARNTEQMTMHEVPSHQLIPDRELGEGEHYRFHFNMTKCIGCRSCEIACSEQNGNPSDIHWRRVGEIEGGAYPDTLRHYLSMGCNHCLDAECVKGCPVDAYTKDAVTGIVLHSADACIGCQYCVWNCPYSVPQFNAERGVVGKCDMCHGRLSDGFEPACVNACPEGAIEIEIFDTLAWRVDFAAADAPGMPPAVHTISTTRITLPEGATSALERVDMQTLHLEHPHWSLVIMTTLIQLAVGGLAAALLTETANVISLILLLAITGVTLSVSVFHLGRPAYAWRALKMWRRSWLSREVLLFGLFFVTLTAATAIAASTWFRIVPLTGRSLLLISCVAAAIGFAGIVASAFIYLVPPRPAWNMAHTPIDFLLSGALLGSVTLPVLVSSANGIATYLDIPIHARADDLSGFVASLAILWLLNYGTRYFRLSHSTLHEHRASASLLLADGTRGVFASSLGLIAMVAACALTAHTVVAAVCAGAGVLASRYLFFVTVVPTNMALMFVRKRAA